MSQSIQEPFQAGEWIVDPELNSLRRGSEERHLEPKVMKVLLTLAERQNHVVSKEELMAAVWPGTFVSDDVLTRCISVLRRATHDDRSTPHFIQTIPKVGYRLVAEIRELPPAPEPTSPPQVVEDVAVPPVEPSSAATEEIAPQPAAVPETASPLPARFRWMPAVTVAAACLLALVALLLWKSFFGSSRDAVLRTLPFTSQAGEQLQPAFSPDGNLVAYVAVAENGASQHLFLKKVGSETVQQLTTGDGDDFSPAWSPDGQQIAYLSRSSNGLGIFLLDLRTHQSRRIFVPQQVTHWEQGALSWSPDGQTLIFPDHPGDSPRSTIFALNVNTLQARAITQPPDGWEGDLTPAFSPDGKRIAFTRASETSVRDLFWITPDGGPVHAMTHDRASIDSIAWSPDSRSVVFSSNRAGKYALWRVRVRGGQPERMPVGTEDAIQPAVSRSGDLTRIAYTEGSAIWSIVEVAEGSNGQSRVVVSSTEEDSAPSLSPDGKHFAFQSQRSGVQEIWTANTDGSGVRQLTHQGGPLTGSPAWAHTRDMILFDSRVNGHSHIFAIPANGGNATQLTFGDFNDITPRWSNDDAAVFFRSNRGGRWQLWRIDLQNRNPEPVTTDDGIVPQLSADGKWIYYTRGGEDGMWRMPVAGGPETRVLDQPATGYWGFWQVTPRGVLYLDGKEQSLKLYDPASGRSSIFAHLKRMPPEFAGLSMTPDGRHVLMTDEEQAGRHITLAEIGRSR